MGNKYPPPSVSAGQPPPSVSAGQPPPSVSAGQPPPSVSAGQPLSSVSGGRAAPMAAAVGRTTAVIAAVLLVPAMATGWLYLLRPHLAAWPGPRVADALPLDELPGTDGMPLAGFLAAFAVAAIMLGLVARAARLNRLTAALSLAAGTGAWLLTLDAFSLFVVRQVPAGQALHDALRVQPVYIAAALAGAAGALLGRGSRGGPGGRPGGLTPRLLGWLVAGAGLIDLVSALVPRLGGTFGVLVRFAPHVVTPAAHLLLVPVGVVLLLTSRGLARGNRRAWRLATGLLGLSVLLQLLRGPDYGAAVLTGLLAIALIARRDDFRHRGDPAARPSAAARLLGLLALALVYGMVALWAYRTAAGLPYRPSAALQDTLRAMAAAARRRGPAAGRVRRMVPDVRAVHRGDRGDLGGRSVAAPMAAAVLPGPAAAGAGGGHSAPLGN